MVSLLPIKELPLKPIEKQGQDASTKDQLDSMMADAQLEQVIGGAKGAGTGAGVVGGAIGLKKMLS